MLYSFRAECMYDVEIMETLLRESAKEDPTFTRVLPDPNIPDVVVEMEVNLFPEDIVAACDIGHDLHVILDTLEAMPIEENVMERKYKY